MEKINLSQANRAHLNANANKKTTAPEVQDNKPIKNGNKRLKLALTCLAVAGTAIAAGVAIYKHQSPSKVVDESKEQVTKLLKDVDFNKGVASLKDGTKFTGVIQDTLKNGDKITMEYADGILKKSAREGSTAFEKVFETLGDGTHKVITSKNGTTTEVIIENLQNAAKKSQDELKELLAKKDTLSPEEFKKQADAIQFKSKNQVAEIDEIVTNKQKLAAEAKEAQERAAREAQEAQERAAREAQIAQERAAQEAQAAQEKALAKQRAALDLTTFEQGMAEMSDSALQEASNECLRQQSALYKKVQERNPDINLSWLNEHERMTQYYTDEERAFVEGLRKKRSIADAELTIRRKKADFEKAKTLIVGETTAPIKAKETGETLSSTIGVQQGKHGQYRREVMVDGRVIGVSENIVMPDKEGMVFNLDEIYDYGKNGLEIKYLGTSEKYKGAGTALIKAAVEDSRAAGFEGRVWVDACGGSLPSDVGRYCGTKFGSSPVPFYYKSGFRMIRPEDNEAIEEGLRILAQTGVYPKTAPQTGNMFLPKEAIDAILGAQ